MSIVCVDIMVVNKNQLPGKDMRESGINKNSVILMGNITAHIRRLVNSAITSTSRVFHVYFLRLLLFVQ